MEIWLIVLSFFCGAGIASACTYVVCLLHARNKDTKRRPTHSEECPDEEYLVVETDYGKS